MMAYFNLILVLLAGLLDSAVSRECRDGEARCIDGGCIQKTQWCDGYSDCYDDSDEQNCADVGMDVYKTDDSLSFGTGKQAVKRAADFLLSQRNSYGNWDTFTPRAIIALSFASKASIISEKENEMLQMQLDMKLLFNLMENNDNMSLSCLALFINALYATCQDPRQFHGIDLVARLRSKTDAAIKEKSSIPVAFLSLSIADSLTINDKYEMVELYNKNAGKTGSRALVVMAMIRYLLSHPGDALESYVNDFFFRLDVSNDDVYSKFLLLQAWTARSKINNLYPLSTAINTTSIPELLSAQQPDGSFGDLLATYYAIPILLNSSLLDLKCDGKQNTGHRIENLISRDASELIYSIWIPSGNDMRSHSMTLNFDGDKSLYDIMLMAEKRDPLFRFSFDETGHGKVVYSIGGVPDDVESGRLWTLYSSTIGNVHMNSEQNMHKETNGVNRIQALNNKHFVFWLKRN